MVKQPRMREKESVNQPGFFPCSHKIFRKTIARNRQFGDERIWVDHMTCGIDESRPSLRLAWYKLALPKGVKRRILPLLRISHRLRKDLMLVAPSPVNLGTARQCLARSIRKRHDVSTPLLTQHLICSVKQQSCNAVARTLSNISRIEQSPTTIRNEHVESRVQARKQSPSSYQYHNPAQEKMFQANRMRILLKSKYHASHS
ncbi:hypothetical protein CC86DRAFT_457031 [Ophiobolus disseminans]|uniref:Uncharacterized protein n=1 Tax=Ophiobolus disseminans TaxID=1469910 RepID=A0A6A6ZSZ4_9PLEO|nr:hypothetical protein CC86DRAFT_457031 [Ophiobolus disseminans]